MFCKIFLFFSCAAGEGVELGGHDGLHEFEYMVAMAERNKKQSHIILPRWMYEE